MWRVDPFLIYPPFLRSVLDALAASEDNGSCYYATNGYRSFAEQACRYRAYKSGNGFRAAPAGSSSHQFGGGIDFVRDADCSRPGIQARWDRSAYDELIKQSRARGLVSGRDFGDNPHVQIPVFVSGRSMAPLRAAWRSARAGNLSTKKSLAMVWDVLYRTGVLVTEKDKVSK